VVIWKALKSYGCGGEMWARLWLRQFATRSGATPNVCDGRPTPTGMLSRLLARLHRFLLLRSNQSLKLLMGLLVNRADLFIPLLRC
jgi:hypothetical protein